MFWNAWNEWTVVRHRRLARGFRPAVELLEGRVTPTTLPTGFSDTLVASGISGPTAMEFAPDGRLFVLEQGGNVKLVHGDGTTFTALHLSIDSAGERGLLGIAFDPNFASNHFAYLYYTNPNPGGAPWATGEHNQLSRFTVNDTDPTRPTFGSEAPILDWNNLSSATNHNGGAIHFGLDGMLYADAGDNAQTFTGPDGNTYRVSQTLANLLGKQLRIDVGKFNSGAAARDDTTVGHLIPADNPFVGTAGGINQLIYALGLRNPYTFAVQPGTGKIFINDVGENTWEEIDQSVAGGNYGWQGGSTDGFGHPPPSFAAGTYHDPLLAYSHAGPPGGIAIVGGTFYNPVTSQFPASYVGKYFYQDLGAGWIRTFDPANPGSASNPDTSTAFATGTPSGLRDLKVDAAGNLYYLSGGDGAVHRISYTAAPVIIDNGQAGYGDAGGGWLSWSGPGYYNNNARYAPAGAGANTATWAFTGLAAGWYTVQADWAGYSAHASNATYSITAGGTTSTAVADQRPASSGPVIGGVGFQTLATVYVTGGTLTVTESDKADGIVVADAVRVAAAAAPTTDLSWSGGGLSGLPATVAPGTPFTVTRAYSITGGSVPEPFAIGYYASPDGKFSDATLLATEAVPAGAAAGTYSGSSPPLQFGAAGTYYLLARLDDSDVVQETDETNDVSPAAGPVTVSGLSSVVIDNGQAGYGDAGGGWLSWSGPGYYNGNARYAPAGAGANTATWTFTGLTAGWYTVQADWAGYSGHASNATYSITTGGITSTAVADQRPASSGTTVGGVGFQALTSAYVDSSGTLTVTLSDKANGIVVADALRVVQAPAPTLDLNWSGGGLSGVPPAAVAGTPFTVTRAYTVSGTGMTGGAFTIGYYASPDGKFFDAALLATETVPAGRSPGTYSGTSPALQFSSAGTYYLLARVDDGREVPETDLTNDVSPAAGPIAVSNPSSAIIDNGQAGYSDTGGGWLSWSGPGYYNNNARYAPAGTGANTATWTFTGLTPGTYQVQADWAAYSAHASNATYAITAGGATTTAVADQRPASSGPVIGGVGFQTLATVTVGSDGTLTVTLSDKADGIVVADALRVVLS